MELWSAIRVAPNNVAARNIGPIRTHSSFLRMNVPIFRPWRACFLLEIEIVRQTRNNAATAP
jgi:hypothetical protein